MAFMRPFTYYGGYHWVETVNGCFIVPDDVLMFRGTPTLEMLAQYAPEGIGFIPLDSEWSAEHRTGWYGRMSAPGYLDCTDWESADTEAELLETLREFYGDDDDSEDDAS